MCDRLPTGNVKPPCKYGSACYQKNPKHLAKFSHPRSSSTDPDPTDGGGDNEATITLSAGKQTTSSTNSKTNTKPQTKGGVTQSSTTAPTAKKAAPTPTGKSASKKKGKDLEEESTETLLDISNARSSEERKSVRVHNFPDNCSDGLIIFYLRKA